MKSKFRFINDEFEMPLLNRNEAWLTNTWVYFIVGLIGALTGMVAVRMMMVSNDFSAAFGVVSGVVLKFGLLVTLVAWCGCTAAAFFNIPELKFATRRSVFNLVALALVFYVCALLSVVAMILIALMIVSFFMNGAGKSKSSSKDDSPTELYDEHGNVHYVSHKISDNRFETTDGRTMRREADGTARDL